MGSKILTIQEGGSSMLAHAVLAMAAAVVDVMHEACPVCGVSLGPHVDSCALAEFHRAAKKLGAFENVERAE